MVNSWKFMSKIHTMTIHVKTTNSSHIIIYDATAVVTYL